LTIIYYSFMQGLQNGKRNILIGLSEEVTVYLYSPQLFIALQHA
jgi:hypothetical protein